MHLTAKSIQEVVKSKKGNLQVGRMLPEVQNICSSALDSDVHNCDNMYNNRQKGHQRNIMESRMFGRSRAGANNEWVVTEYDKQKKVNIRTNCMRKACMGQTPI